MNYIVEMGRLDNMCDNLTFGPSLLYSWNTSINKIRRWSSWNGRWCIELV